MLLIELMGKVDIRLAVQEVPQIYTCSLKVHRIDLKIAPIKCTVRVVMINLAAALWIFSALDR